VALGNFFRHVVSVPTDYKAQIKQLRKANRELHDACEERLTLLNRMHAECELRLDLINRLTAECRERDQVIASRRERLAKQDAAGGTALGDNDVSKPLFSVVIPTRERAETLTYALRTCLEQDFDDYEVVVCDNCSSPATRAVIQASGSD